MRVFFIFDYLYLHFMRFYKQKAKGHKNTAHDIRKYIARKKRDNVIF